MTPRKAAGDEHVSSSRNGRNAPKSTSTGSMMGLVRAAAAVRRSKKDGLVRRSADHRGEFGPGIRVSAGSKPDCSHLTNLHLHTRLIAVPRRLHCGDSISTTKTLVFYACQETCWELRTRPTCLLPCTPKLYLYHVCMLISCMYAHGCCELCHLFLSAQ